jgi:hypothetical protein
MEDAKIVGGSAADRKKLLELHEQYLVANGKFDWPAIQPMWSEQPHATFFNLNGHTYSGAAHWSRLWAFYIKNVKGSYWTPYDIRWRDQRRHGGDLVPPPLAAQLGRLGPAAARHPLPGPGVRQPLDDGVPQGERPMACRARAFLGRRFRRAARRRVTLSRDTIMKRRFQL